MQLSRAFRHCLTGDAQRIIDVVRVGVRLARCAKETAELAIDIADVCRIEMAIDVEISRTSMFPSPNRVGEFAERIKILRAE